MAVVDTEAVVEVTMEAAVAVMEETNITVQYFIEL